MYRPTHSPRGGILLSTLVALVALTACDSGSTAPEEPAATTLDVTPESATLSAIGETTTLSAAVLDQNGQPFAGAAVTWSSIDPSIASVDAAGVVTAVGVGSTTVTASSGELIANAAITVTQTPATVTTAPDTVLLLVGETQTVTATVKDAGGTVIPAAMVSWASDAATVATVSTGGVVTGVAAGFATITATAGGASGTTLVSVSEPLTDVLVPNDTTLTGTINAASLTVPTGVTVTLADDLTLSTTGPISIDGTLQGDCVGLDLSAGGALTLTGATLNTECTAAPEGGAPTLRIGGSAEIVIEGADIRSGGDLVVSGNAPASSVIAARSSGPNRNDQVTTDCRLGGASYLGGGAGSEAVLSGTDGDAGGSVIVDCNGNLEVDRILIGSGAGGAGMSDIVTGTRPARGGAGGHGGDIRISAAGDILFRVQLSEAFLGKGGAGGDARHTSSSAEVAASAVGGRGGNSGRLFIQGEFVESFQNGVLTVQVGGGGAGGAALAVGADAEPGQPGGAASALGGAGGDVYSQEVALFGERVGIDVVSAVPVNQDSRSVVEFRIADPQGGKGGDAEARPGRGGDGAMPGAAGLPGGSGEAQGGKGGDVLLFDNGGRAGFVSIRPGAAGRTDFEDGQGGNGAPAVCLPGGAGGVGGSASGVRGTVGRAHPLETHVVAPPAAVLYFADFGVGGNGGSGQPGGAAGAGGDIVPGNFPDFSFDEEIDSFEPGVPGASEGCETTTAMDLGWVVKSDPNEHRTFVNFESVLLATFRFQLDVLALTMQTAGIIYDLTGTVTTPSGVPMSAESFAAAAVVSPGTYSFSLSGRGTAAGRSDVLTTFIGTMEVDGDGNITSLTGDMTVDAENNKFPGDGNGVRNPIVYGVTATPAAGTPPADPGKR